MKIRDLFETIQVSSYDNKGEKVHRFKTPGGFLDYSLDDGIYLLLMVEVEEHARNRGIATMLLEKFFEMVDKRGGTMMLTEFLEDGERYLKGVVERLKSRFKNIKYV